MDRRLQFIADRRDRVRFGLHFRQKILRLKNSNHNKGKSTNHPPVPLELFWSYHFSRIVVENPD
jgi:hypothetical protein